MATIDIRMTDATKALLADLSKSGQKRFDSVTKKAGASASRAMFTAIQRTVRSERSIKISEVKKLVTMIVNPTAGIWSIRVNGDSARVSSTQHRQVKRGVKFQPRKGKWALIEGGFVATMPGGHKGVFKRVDGDNRRKRITTKSGNRSTSQLPIVERYTSGIAAVFLDEQNRSVIDAKGQEIFYSTLDRLIRAGEGGVK